MILLLVVAGLYSAPSRSERRLFADQAAHISAALSIWHDHDLEYTLKDLRRFREIMPAEPGPRGAFLKAGFHDKLYYAKPFLYALVSAPFVGLFGLDGFFFVNMVCLCILGLLTIKILSPRFGKVDTGLILLGFFVFSPFLAWASVAHPDVFIATLLAVGSYLLLRIPTSRHYILMGSFLLGLLVYEKPPFFFIVVFVALALYRRIPLSLYIGLTAALLSGWLIPTAINYLQDGSLTSYQGIRFAVTGARLGEFPLEHNWTRPAPHPILNSVFNPLQLLQSLWANIGLVPSKAVDMVIGRQTGLLLYFPVSVVLVCLLILGANWQTLCVLVGFVGVLTIQCLAFPSNGYGGAHTYGPRYTMQILSIIPVAFLLARQVESNANLKSITGRRSVLGAALIWAVMVHYQVIPPSLRNVAEAGNFLKTPLARLFPLESSLLPSICQLLPKNLSLSDGNDNYVYMFCDDALLAGLPIIRGSSLCTVTFYQLGRSRPFPSVGIASTLPAHITLNDREGQVMDTYIQPGRIDWDTVKFSFNYSYYDMSMKREIRWQKMEIETRIDGSHASRLPPLLTLTMGRAGHDTYFSQFNVLIHPKDFAQHSIYTLFGWYDVESWGMWSWGSYSALYIPLKDCSLDYALDIDAHAYTPKERPELKVDVYINQTYVDTWLFYHGSHRRMNEVRIQSSVLKECDGIMISFHVHEPRSPAELGLSQDARTIGLGIRGIRVKRLDTRSKWPFNKHTAG